jgi:hypothetical protein
MNSHSWCSSNNYKKRLNRFEEVVRPLREEVATLKRLLAHDGVAMEPTDAHALVPPDSAEQNSFVVEDEHLYSCFSPRGSFSPCAGASSTVTAPTDVDAAVLFGGVLTPPPVEEVRPGSHKFSDVASPPCEALAFEKCGDIDASVSLSAESGRQVVHIHDTVAKSGLLPMVPGAIVAKEVSEFLAILAVAFQGSAVD